MPRKVSRQKIPTQGKATRKSKEEKDQPEETSKPLSKNIIPRKLWKNDPPPATLETPECSARSKKKQKLDELLQNVEDVLGKDQSSHPSPRQSSHIASQRAGDGVGGATGVSAAAGAPSTGEPETDLPLCPFKEVKDGFFEKEMIQSLFFPKGKKKGSYLISCSLHKAMESVYPSPKLQNVSPRLVRDSILENQCIRL